MGRLVIEKAGLGMGPEGQQLVLQGMVKLRIVTVGIAMVGRPDGRLIIRARA